MYLGEVSFLRLHPFFGFDLLSINCLMQKYGLTSKLLSDFELLNKVCALYKKNQHCKFLATIG